MSDLIWCPICVSEHAPPACNADWEKPCARCGRRIGGPAEGVPDDVCWSCHMNLTDTRDERYGILLRGLYRNGDGEDAYDRPFRDMFREPRE